MNRERASLLRTKLDSFPRAVLLPRPTPLDHLVNLSAALDVDFWLKRDDLTPITFGGDKPRKLEFELGRAIAEGADIVVTCGASQSNHARLTTASARRFGLDTAVVLSRDAHTELQGNLLTVSLMGADITLAETDDHWALEEEVAGVMARLRASGRHPYYIPVSGTTPLSCLGYVAATLEIMQQLEARDTSPDVHYVPFGTGGIFAATLLTYRWLEIETPLVGVSINGDLERCRGLLDQWWGGLGELLSIDADRGSHEITDAYIGREYGHATAAGLEAITLMARAEGILLDPVYSGKVMSAVVDHIRRGRVKAGEHVLMLHSGGSPALFAYHEQIAAHLEGLGQGLGLGN